MKKIILILTALAIICSVLLLVVGCGSDDSAQTNTLSVDEAKQTSEQKPAETKPSVPVSTAPPKETVVGYSVKDCNFISGEDIKKILSLSEFSFEDTPTGINNTDFKCNKFFVGTKDHVPSGHSVIYDITDTSSGSAAEQSLAGLCKDKSSLNLGAYQSCSVGSMLFYGKAKYLIGVQCSGCESGKDIEFAELIESRIN